MSGTDIYHEMIIDYSQIKIENPDVTYHDKSSVRTSIDIDLKVDRSHH